MSTPLISEMLQLFQTGATSYQPSGMIFESGDPLVTDANIHRLLSQGRVIMDALVSPVGVLFIFTGGEQYYTPALRLGADGLPTEKLAEIAAEAGYGDLEELLDYYSGLPATFTGHLPDLRPEPGTQPGNKLNATFHNLLESPGSQPKEDVTILPCRPRQP